MSPLEFTLIIFFVSIAAGVVGSLLGLGGGIVIIPALTLGMNHPRGPFELLESVGAAEVYTSLRSMAELIGDPRYRPAQLLRRQSVGAAR